MKKLSKIIPAILLFVMIVSVVGTVFGANSTGGIIDPKNFTGTSTNDFNKMGNQIIGIIQAIGSIASVAILVVIGVKYMMGSAEEKAEYKKTLLPYVIGAILVFAASNVASLIFNFGKDFAK